MMKAKYLELMLKALSAYSDDHIHEYFERVKAEGLTVSEFTNDEDGVAKFLSKYFGLD